MEKTIASLVKETRPYLEAKPSPRGYQGLVLVYGCKKESLEVEVLSMKVLKIERAFIIQTVALADPGRIAEIIVKTVEGKIHMNHCFAVKTVRRGAYSFTSINNAVGITIKGKTDARVNLTKSNVVIRVEIIEESLHDNIPGISSPVEIPG